MITASATSRSRSRSESNSGSGSGWAVGLAALVLALSSGATGCGDDGEREGEVDARVDAPGGTLELDRRVVENIAAREGISHEQARGQALDTLRLVAARRAELAARETAPEHPDDLNPARRAHLERAALVRLWLREVFEPAHAAARIPSRVIEQNMVDPNLTRRLFHPELYFVCQALLVPGERGEDGRNALPPSEGEDAERWRATAERAFAPVVDRLAGLEDELVDGRECSLLSRIIGASERELESETGALTLRFERFVFTPDAAEGLDPDWVEPVAALSEPGLTQPFFTRFGLHLVIVTEIQPAELADGSLPPEQLAAARESRLRAELETPWRADQLQRTLAEIRDRRIVRLGKAALPQQR